MKITSDSEYSLEKSVKREINYIKKRVKESRLANPNKKHTPQDYPAVIVACKCLWKSDIYFGESRSPVNYKYEERIKNRLELLGNICSKRKECPNIIGSCAEPHAADKVVKVLNCDLDKLKFSNAYRPRTTKVIRYCLNCKQTFKEVL